MKRKFKHQTLPMLIAALVVADHFEQEKEALITEMPDWTDPFISDYRTEIEQLLNASYGVSSKEELQSQTILVNELSKKAKNDLTMVKTQIERGFRTNPEHCNRILTKLGFSEYWSKALHNNQSAMIGMLLTFRNNLTPPLQTELEENKVNATRISNILTYGDALNKANISQESLKGSSKLDTEEMVTTLNAIYEHAMDICEIGKNLFKHDPLKKELFVFSKLVKAQGSTHAGQAPEEETSETEVTNE